MNRRLLSLSILLLITFIFSACQVDDIIDNPSDTNSITATIDGEAFSVSGILVSAEYIAQNQMIQSMAIGGVKFPLNGVTQSLALAIVSIDSTGIAVDDVYNSGTVAKTAAGEYVLKDANTDIKAFSSNTNVAIIVITDINLTTKRVSGTFSFDASDDDDSTKIYKIRDGVFKDISFN